jgi:hypothetical protein
MGELLDETVALHLPRHDQVGHGMRRPFRRGPRPRIVSTVREVEVASSKKSQVEAEQQRLQAKAADEAQELLEQMLAQTEVVAAFLAKEQSSVARRGLSTKRLARLRLMSDDLSSAARFASKSVKG